MVRRRVVVSGLVQGVWFRQSCRLEAEQLGVRGWVRNLPDGRVEAAFEGESDVVERMVAWCHDGPPRAAVVSVEVVEEEPEGASDFTVT